MGQLRTPVGDAPADILAALGALAECSARLEHEPLKGAMGQATVALFSHIEGRCRESVAFLLAGLGSPAEAPEMQQDKLWTLRTMVRRSSITKRWILESDGLKAVAAAMATHPGHEELMTEGVWLVHDLCDVEGVAELLKHSSLAVQATAGWALRDLVKERRVAGTASAEDWPEARGAVLALAGALRPLPVTRETSEVRWACCDALRRFVHREMTLASLLLAHGGGETALASICVAQSFGTAEEGQNLLAAGAQLVSALVDGSDQAVQQLKHLGALEVLARSNSSWDGSAEEVIWALGQIGGVGVVADALSQPHCAQSWLHGGLVALAELAWSPSDDELSSYAQIAPQVLQLAQAYTVPGAASAEDTSNAVRAVGGFTLRLVQKAAPGAWNVTDSCVALLMKSLGPESEEPTVQAAAESLGRIAVEAPAWRGTLKAAMGTLSHWLRSPEGGDHRVQKYLFWAAAAIAGLPAVIQEMRARSDMSSVQDAAICSIIDILDDDLDGDFSLSATGEAADAKQGAHVPEAVAVIVEAMRLHRAFAPVQSRGSHALGLLYKLRPDQESSFAAMDATLAALWRHPHDERVAAGACSAIRAFLEPGRGATSSAVAGAAADALRARGAGQSLKDVLQEHLEAVEKEGSEVPEMLEDASYALGLLEGVHSVLKALVTTGPKAVVLRGASLKALFELGRCFPGLLAPPVAGEILAMLEAFSKEEGGAPLQRHAELLRGLISQPA